MIVDKMFKEDEIKVGEWIRTKTGTIAKIGDIEYDIKIGMNTGKLIYRNWKEDFCGSYVLYEEIVKHSPNIIDLIEVGDYVNGLPVVEVIPSKDWIEICDEVIEQKEVIALVTKEQFKAMEYEVK